MSGENANKNRFRKINEADSDFEKNSGPVVYWMSRDQRIKDNFALEYAQKIAKENKRPLIVFFALVDNFLEAQARQFGFMLRGLESLSQKLSEKNIPFVIEIGEPSKTVVDFVKKNKTPFLVTDFDPLKIKKKWKKDISREINIPFIEVDTHNIIPVWVVSQKQEYGAYTLRPKIKKILSEYINDNFDLKKHPFDTDIKPTKFSTNSLLEKIKIKKDVAEVDWIKPGETEAIKHLKYFIENVLKTYDTKRNDPNQKAQSNMSPYLHFGQIASITITKEINNSKTPIVSKEAYLEELIVRKELSDNFCEYNSKYDSTDGFPDWAKKSFEVTRKDKREFLYTKSDFEKAKTHDDLWNAAQMEMVKTGKMHGYMRMYWAKKILEWTENPEKAMDIAIYLNDKYELDGRDPNGYAGISWSIGGTHDRAWFKRPIFGQIRFMSHKGCEGKFDTKQYIFDNLK